MKATIRIVIIEISILSFLVLILLVIPIGFGGVQSHNGRIHLALYGSYPEMGNLQYVVLVIGLLAFAVLILSIVPATVLALIMIVTARSRWQIRDMALYFTVLGMSWLLVYSGLAPIYLVVKKLFD